MTLIESFEKIFDRILDCFITLACILLSLVTFSVCLDVILRYFFNRPQVWVLELSEYALLYITFLGAAWVLRSEGHVSVDLLTEVLRPKTRAFFYIVSQIIISMVSVVLVIYGIRVTWVQFSKGIYNPTILEVPKSVIFIIIPVGGITLLIQSLRGIIRGRKDIKNDR